MLDNSLASSGRLDGGACFAACILPSILHADSRHSGDLPTAGLEIGRADREVASCAARAGLLLGAAHGLSVIPPTLVEHRSAREEIASLLDGLPALRAESDCAVVCRLAG